MGKTELRLSVDAIGDHIIFRAQQEHGLSIESVIWLTPEDASKLVDDLVDGIETCRLNRAALAERREAVQA